MSDTDIDEINARLRLHGEQLLEAATQVARLSMVAIALVVRRDLPQAATVGLAWCDQECDDHLTPEGYYTADGQQIDLPPEYRIEDPATWTAGLNVAIYPYCTGLGEINRDTWEPFTITDDGAGGPLLANDDHRLIIGDVLAAHQEEVAAP